LKESTYGNEIAFKDTKTVLSMMSTISMTNILHTTCYYYIKDEVKNIQAKTFILYGEKEAKLCKKSAEFFTQLISRGRIICLPGYQHGELAIGNPDKQLELISQLVEWK
jgi:hypothetical protein